MNIHIIYQNFMLPDEKNFSVGGVQTYILNLAKLLYDKKYKVTIHQASNHNFNAEFSYGKIIAYDKDFLLRALKTIPEYDIVIFGTDTYATSKRRGPTIAIQHGIYWDCPTKQISTFTRWRRKFKDYYQILTRIKNVDTLVCVDYNFINWYRALVNNPKVNLVAIPNFCEIPELKPVKTGETSIIFARRFFDYRGTRLFAKVAGRLMDIYPNINITIAGEGPDEGFLRSTLKHKNITFTKYKASESLFLHRDKHIAVVPTLGSEGTSLSLLESMAAGCCPVCTNVGGMTNIVIDHYNGLMVSPDEEELYEALSQLIENNQLREKLANYAFETVKYGFNLNLWQNKWLHVIRNVSDRYFDNSIIAF